MHETKQLPPGEEHYRDKLRARIAIHRHRFNEGQPGTLNHHRYEMERAEEYLKEREPNRDPDPREGMVVALDLYIRNQEMEMEAEPRPLVRSAKRRSIESVAEVRDLIAEGKALTDHQARYAVEKAAHWMTDLEPGMALYGWEPRELRRMLQVGQPQE